MFNPDINVENIEKAGRLLKRTYNIYKFGGSKSLASSAIVSIRKALEVKKLEVLENIPFLEKRREEKRTKIENLDELNLLIGRQADLLSQLKKSVAKKDKVDLNTVKLLNKSINDVAKDIALKRKEVKEGVFEGNEKEQAEYDKQISEEANKQLRNINLGISKLFNKKLTSEQAKVASDTETFQQVQVENTTKQKHEIEDIKKSTIRTEDIISDQVERESVNETTINNKFDKSNENTDALLEEIKTVVKKLDLIRGEIARSGGGLLGGAGSFLGPAAMGAGATGILGKAGQFAKSTGGKIGQLAKGAGGKVGQLAKGAGGLAAKGATSLTGLAASGGLTGAATTAGAVAAAGAAGYAVGTGIDYVASKIIQSATDGEVKNLGELAERSVSDRAKASQREEDIKKWTPRLSPEAFKLMGGNENFSPIIFPSLRRSGQLVAENGLWVTKEESATNQGLAEKPQEQPVNVNPPQETIPEQVEKAVLEPAPMAIPEMEKPKMVTPEEVNKGIENPYYKEDVKEKGTVPILPLPVSSINEEVKLPNIKAKPEATTPNLPENVVKYEREKKKPEKILSNIENKIGNTGKSTPVPIPVSGGGKGGSSAASAKRDSIADYGIDLVRTSLS